MAELLIRNIEHTTVERLKAQAKLHKRSLQGELKAIIEAATKMTADEAKQVTAAWRKRLSGKSFSDSTELVREDRNR
jgi:plasmid stability protein